MNFPESQFCWSKSVTNLLFYLFSLLDPFLIVVCFLSWPILQLPYIQLFCIYSTFNKFTLYSWNNIQDAQPFLISFGRRSNAFFLCFIILDEIYLDDTASLLFVFKNSLVTGFP